MIGTIAKHILFVGSCFAIGILYPIPTLLAALLVLSTYWAPLFFRKNIRGIGGSKSPGRETPSVEPVDDPNNWGISRKERIAKRKAQREEGS